MSTQSINLGPTIPGSPVTTWVDTSGDWSSALVVIPQTKFYEDLNNDGKPDLEAPAYSGERRVEFLVNQTAGDYADIATVLRLATDLARFIKQFSREQRHFDRDEMLKAIENQAKQLVEAGQARFIGAMISGALQMVGSIVSVHFEVKAFMQGNSSLDYVKQAEQKSLNINVVSKKLENAKLDVISHPNDIQKNRALTQAESQYGRLREDVENVRHAANTKSQQAQANSQLGAAINQLADAASSIPRAVYEYGAVQDEVESKLSEKDQQLYSVRWQDQSEFFDEAQKLIESAIASLKAYYDAVDSTNSSIIRAIG